MADYTALTEAGMALREQAITVPPRMGACVNLSQEDAMELYRILHLLIDNIGK